MHPVVIQIAKEYKTTLQELYGSELAELVLFGSFARGDHHEESDVDFAIVLYNPQTRTMAELFKISPIASRLSLKYGLMVSSLPLALYKKQTSMQCVFVNMRNEGIAI